MFIKRNILVMIVIALTLFLYIFPSMGAPWDKFNLSPSTRNVTLPVKAQTLTWEAPSYLYDFGKDVGGTVTLVLGSVVGTTDPLCQLGVAFSETTFYTESSDDSNGGQGPDGTLLLTNVLMSNKNITTPLSKLRGGFRYFRVFLTCVKVSLKCSVTIDAVVLHFSPAPTMLQPNLYANHFYTDNDLLNRIWYAGAYTVQLDTISPSEGRLWPPPPSGWWNNASAGIGNTILVDGAKRDRMAWGGDCGVSIPTAYVSTGDTLSSANAVETIFNCQDDSTGMFSMVGPPICNFFGSDTYHLWAIIGVCNVHGYRQDTVWLQRLWPRFIRGLQTSTSKIGPKGLMVVNETGDWARCCMGGENIAANSLLYRSLTCGAELATSMGNGTLSSKWTDLAHTLQRSVNEVLWDDVKGAFIDSPHSALYPQDGNSLALWFGVVTNSTRAAQVSSYLQRNWGMYGSQTPEWGYDIGTFPGSLEVLGHMAANQTKTALDLILLQWGYMLQYPYSTQSTFWEGYLSNGSLGYGGSYMSNAHGWATGPVSALTNSILGVSQVGLLGRKWRVVVPGPEVYDVVRHAEGSLRLDIRKGGAVHVLWDVCPNSRNLTLSIDATSLFASSGVAATGTVGVPILAGGSTLMVNGWVVWKRDQGWVNVEAVGHDAHSQENGYLFLFGLSSASKITVSFS